MGGAAMVAGISRPADLLADGKRRKYAVSVLGDTHFDTVPESVYHSHYDESNPWAKVQHAEFRRNGEMWRERCPAMLAASAKLADRHPTDFILQLGDIIQGDCDHVPTHRKMLDDCIRMLRAPYPSKMPFLTVMGNHDFRGKGARKAYLDFAEPFMAKEIGKLNGASRARVKYPVFSFRYGGDEWIFCNFETKKGLGAVCDLVEGAKTARHVFLVSHGPFTAHAATSSPRWRLAGSRECEAVRRRLYEALSRRHAIVISGHMHTTSFYRHENESGGFSEVTVNSVWMAPELATATPFHSSPAEYDVPAKKVNPKALADYQREISFFKSGIKEYFCGRGAGHYRLNVSDGEVSMEFYPGDADRAARKFVLKS